MRIKIWSIALCFCMVSAASIPNIQHEHIAHDHLDFEHPVRERTRAQHTEGDVEMVDAMARPTERSLQEGVDPVDRSDVDSLQMQVNILWVAVALFASISVLNSIYNLTHNHRKQDPSQHACGVPSRPSGEVITTGKTIGVAGGMSGVPAGNPAAMARIETRTYTGANAPPRNCLQVGK